MSAPIFPYQVAVRKRDGSKTLLHVEHSSEEEAVRLVVDHVGSNNIAAMLVGLPNVGELIAGHADAEYTEDEPA